jgi:hypothetical protein
MLVEIMIQEHSNLKHLLIFWSFNYPFFLIFILVEIMIHGSFFFTNIDIPLQTPYTFLYLSFSFRGLIPEGPPPFQNSNFGFLKALSPIPSFSPLFYFLFLCFSFTFLSISFSSL